MNFTDRLDEPAFLGLDIHDSQVINTLPNVVKSNILFMRRNKIETQDAWIEVENTWESEFYDVGKKMLQPINTKAKGQESLLYKTTLFLTS